MRFRSCREGFLEVWFLNALYHTPSLFTCNLYPCLTLSSRVWSFLSLLYLLQNVGSGVFFSLPFYTRPVMPCILDFSGFWIALRPFPPFCPPSTLSFLFFFCFSCSCTVSSYFFFVHVDEKASPADRLNRPSFIYLSLSHLSHFVLFPCGVTPEWLAVGKQTNLKMVNVKQFENCRYDRVYIAHELQLRYFGVRPGTLYFCSARIMVPQRHSMHIRCIISINRTKPPQGESVTVFITTGMSILVYYIYTPPPPPKTVVVYLHLWRGLGKLILFLPLGVALSFFFSFLLLCLGWFASGLPWIPPNSSHAREH